MPKSMCRDCGELCYLSEIDEDGYCFECSEKKGFQKEKAE